MNNRVLTAVLTATVALAAVLLASLLVKPLHEPVHARTRSQAAPRFPLPSAEGFTETTSEPEPTAPPRHSHSEINQQDSYNRTEAFRGYLRAEHRERPAFQHLPYRSSEVHIQITNVTSDGRLVLEVTPLGLNVNPRVAYRRFLVHYHDPGSAYLAQYGRYQP